MFTLQYQVYLNMIWLTTLSVQGSSAGYPPHVHSINNHVQLHNIVYTAMPYDCEIANTLNFILYFCVGDLTDYCNVSIHYICVLYLHVRSLYSTCIMEICAYFQYIHLALYSLLKLSSTVACEDELYAIKIHIKPLNLKRQRSYEAVKITLMHTMAKLFDYSANLQ